MRTYYIFNINKSLSYIYQKNPYKIYKMLEEIYHTCDKDLVLTYKFFEQVAYPFDKNKINSYLKNKYSYEKEYDYNNNMHIYLSSKETSKILINNTHIKIKTNINYPIFFDGIDNYQDNLFVCDFQNKDYFWLDEIHKKDCQNKEYLVK